MPLTLHHGPASQHKLTVLNQLLSAASTKSITSTQDWNNSFPLTRNQKPKTKNLVVANLYPLHAGQREILRRLKQTNPNLTIHVFYDESFDQTHNALENAYLDLGQMADNTIHYDPPTETHTIHELKTPIHETRFIVSEIKKRISEGAKPEDLVIVLLDTEERSPLERALLTANIPHTLDMELPLADVLPQNTPIQTQQSNNVFLQRKIKAQQLMQTSMGEYADSPLQPTFTPPVAPHSVIVTTLDRALAYKDRQIFVMGLSFEPLAAETIESDSPDNLAAQNEFAELGKSPGYRMHVALIRLQQLLGYAKNIFLTRAEMDRASRPLMRVSWPHLNQAQSSAEKSPLHHNSHYSHKSYNTHAPSSLSVSALQEYLDCPYSYYAKYILKAEPLKKKQLEPDGKTRGAFVHDVLKRLFHAYGSQLVQPEAQLAIHERLQSFIDHEVSANPDFKTFHFAVIKEFTDRVLSTLTALISRESLECAEQIKKTIPKFCEWDFGKSSERRFEFPTPDGPIHITGRIDRIDVNDENKQFSVVDFKTGSLPTLNEIVSGQALQLPLYLMAVQKILSPEFTPTAALYYGLKTDRVFGFALKNSSDEKTLNKRNVISASEWQETQRQTLVHCVHVVHSVHKGQFNPQPYNTKKCDYCDFKRICGYKP